MPTVERGLRFWSVWVITTAGEAFFTRSTAGFAIPWKDMASRYCRWHSIYRTSIKSVDFPEPDSPVNTVRLFRGISSEICFRFFSEAFTMEMGFMDGSFGRILIMKIIPDYRSGFQRDIADTGDMIKDKRNCRFMNL